MSIVAAAGAAAAGGIGNTVVQQIGGKKKQKRAYELQSKLNRETAELNYQYGEMAADSAHGRTLDIYQRQKEDTSYKAQVQDALEAGLSPSIFGNQGAGGGQGGGGAQGSGARGIQPADVAALEGVANERRALSIEGAKAAAETARVYAEAKKTKAEIKNIEADTKKKEEETSTSQELTPLQADLLKSEAVKNWQENGAFTDKNAVEIAEAWSRVAKNESDIELNETAKEVNMAMAELNTEKKKALWKELMIAQQNANSNEIQAKSVALAAEHGTGKLGNWKSWRELSENVWDGIKDVPKTRKEKKMEKKRNEMEKLKRYPGKGK